MNKKIIVVGADYAGIVAAALIADKGFDVTLYEKKDENQLDNKISETLDPNMLAITGLGLPQADKWLSCDDPSFFSPYLEKEFHRTTPDIKKNIKIDSKDLFEHMLTFAKKRNVKLRFCEKVASPIIFGDRVTGIITESGEKDYAALVIDCAGINSPFKKALPESKLIKKGSNISYTYFTRVDSPTGSFNQKRKIIVFPDNQKIIADISPNAQYTDIKIISFEPLTKAQNNSFIEKLRQTDTCIGQSVVLSSCRKSPSHTPLLCPVCDGYAAAGTAAFMANPILGETATAALKAAKLISKAVGKDNKLIFSKETLWQYNCDYFKVAGASFLILDYIKNVVLSMECDGVDKLFKSGVLNDSDFCIDTDKPFLSLDISSFIQKLKIAQGSPDLFKKLAEASAKIAALKAVLAAMPQNYSPKYFDIWQKSLKKVLR